MKSLNYLNDIKAEIFIDNKDLATILEYVRYILTDNDADTSVLEELIEIAEEMED